MLARRRAMAWINLVGGSAVLASYAYCLAADPARAGDFWGGVPEGLRSLYTVNMGLATAGYFAFTFFLMFRLKPDGSGRGPVGVGTFNALYALILLPSALWMPLTFAMLEAPSVGLWWAIRSTLAAVGLGSLGLWPSASRRWCWMRWCGRLTFPSSLGASRSGSAGSEIERGSKSDANFDQDCRDRALRLAGRACGAGRAVEGAAGRPRLHPPFRLTVLS
jgi:hypothetical protein